jgi:hypothetical protein
VDLDDRAVGDQAPQHGFQLATARPVEGEASGQLLDGERLAEARQLVEDLAFEAADVVYGENPPWGLDGAGGGT